jgi:hypothetical protein
MLVSPTQSNTQWSPTKEVERAPSVFTKFYFERFRLGLITKISKKLFQKLVWSPISLFPGKKQK